LPRGLTATELPGCGSTGPGSGSGSLGFGSGGGVGSGIGVGSLMAPLDFPASLSSRSSEGKLGRPLVKEEA